MSSLRATLAASVLALGAFVAPVAGMTPLRLVPDCVGAGANHAAVVVEHGDGRIVTACVAFASATISGVDLLRLSGIEYATSSFAGLGDAVCQLDGEPASYPAGCWSASSPYWVLFVARGGAWAVASVGMSSLSFADGDAEGFRYQAQTATAQPPSARGRCPALAPPTSTPAPSSRATPEPASTAQAAPRPTPASRQSPSAGARSVAPSATRPAPSSSGPTSTDTAASMDVPPALAAGSGGSPAPPLTAPASDPSDTSDPSAAAASASTTAGVATWLGAGGALVLLAVGAVAASRRRSGGGR